MITLGDLGVVLLSVKTLKKIGGMSLMIRHVRKVGKVTLMEGVLICCCMKEHLNDY